MRPSIVRALVEVCWPVHRCVLMRRPADGVLVNGKIVIVDDRFTITEALAVVHDAMPK
jgi:hypothetical protein